MSIWVFVFCLVMFWVALHFLIKDQVERQVEDKVARQLDHQSELVQRHHQAVTEVRDQLRRTSHDLLSTAIDAGARPEVIDLDDFNRTG